LSGYQGRPGWLYAIIPFAAIGSTVGSFVKLYILDLGGNVLDVGFASSAFNLALIPAAFISGRLTDYLGRRRVILIVSAGAQLASIALMSLTRSLPIVIVLYAVYSFTSMFSPTVFSLLMMETMPKERWGDGSATTFRYNIYGSIIGLVLGVVVLTMLPLTAMALLPVAFSGIMLAISVLVVRDPQITLERRNVTFNVEALITRLVQLPVLLIRVPRVNDFRRLLSEARNALTRDIPIIMVTSALFSLAANLFFTSYTPFLKSNSLSYLEIVGLDLFVTVINALASLPRFSRLSKRGDPGLIIEFLSLRAIAFLLAAVTSLYFTGHPVFYVTLLLYLLIGMAYTNFAIGVNTMLYRFLPEGRQGGTLGVYSAMNSVAMFAGSLASGSLSFYFGYAVTFLLASVSLFGAASLFEWHFKPRRQYAEEPL
jgi:MFS family permease